MAKCRGCGAEIIWAMNENGKLIPLDAKAPVYLLTEVKKSITEVEKSTRCVRVGRDDLPACYVSHFATCPKANEFSGSKKK